MPDPITCPHCRRLLEMPAAYDGSEVRCPECQGVFMAGAQGAITAQSPQPAALPAASEVHPGMPPAGERARTTAFDDELPESVALGSEYRPGGRLAFAVKLLLGLNLLLNLAMLASAYLQYNLAI